MNEGEGSASQALPSAKSIRLASNVTLQPPLSRRGQGPGLLILVPGEDNWRGLRGARNNLDPEPVQKWAEEGFTVLELKIGDSGAAEEASAGGPEGNVWNMQDACEKGLHALMKFPDCTSESQIGVIVYKLNLKPNSPEMEWLWQFLHGAQEIAAVVYFLTPITGLFRHGKSTREPPLMVHHAGGSIAVSDLHGGNYILHVYESALSTYFVLPSHNHYEGGAASVCHTRSLGFLKKHLGGPNFDLEAIWDEHTLFEFGERSVAKTMATMVQEPYVNHVPTMTGGVGRSALTAFYRDHFIFNNSDDTKLELVSRTVGVDRVVDEFIFSFTHDRVIDWLVPGIPPTHNHCQIPFTSVVNVRGDRLYHEHIAWDQATVLRQLGLLPEYLPFPYPLPDGRLPAKGKHFEYRVPAAGVETAKKLVNESNVPSNEMLGYEIREVDDIYGPPSPLF